WATRLIRQANGRLFLDERDLWPNRQFVSTHLVVTKKFLEQHRDIVKQWLRVHVELTNWINANLPEARRILNQQIRKDTSAEIPPQILEESFSRLQVTYDPLRSSLLAAAQLSQEAGFLGRKQVDLSRLHDLSLLNEVLAEKKLKAIP